MHIFVEDDSGEVGLFFRSLVAERGGCEWYTQRQSWEECLVGACNDRRTEEVLLFTTAICQTDLQVGE